MGVWPRICVLNRCKSLAGFTDLQLYSSMKCTRPGTASWTMLKFQAMLGYTHNLTWDFKITLTSKNQKSNQIVFWGPPHMRRPGLANSRQKSQCAPLPQITDGCFRKKGPKLRYFRGQVDGTRLTSGIGLPPVTRVGHGRPETMSSPHTRSSAGTGPPGTVCRFEPPPAEPSFRRAEGP